VSAKEPLHCVLLLGLVFALPLPAGADQYNTDMSDQLKKSLVYINISTYIYNQMQPWKSPEIVEKAGFGCAVGPFEVLTTARNASDAAFIKTRRHGQNEFIPADVKVIDYQSNLCLLELDKEAVGKPLEPIDFVEDYDKGAPVQSYWLSAAGHLTTGRGYLDEAKVYKSTTSYASFLNFTVANASTAAAQARLYCMGKKPVGVACWADGNAQEVGLIPSVTINRFLADARDGRYEGFGTAGFTTTTLLDPTMRAWLKMPEDMKTGVYVARVNNLGTGSDILKENDVILAIDEHSLNAYGRFEHEQFDRVSYHHLITSHSIGEDVIFDIWRDGKNRRLQTKARNFNASEMLVPYYEYGKQPEYIVTAGFVFQRLTRDYLQIWGDGWSGKVPPHLYHYYRDMAFKPSDQRRDIVILSYVLPADINLGYHGLGQMVVSTFNGAEITSLSDIIEAQKLNPESKFDVVEFEHDYPTIVIPRTELQFADITIARTYGITKLVNVSR